MKTTPIISAALALAFAPLAASAATYEIGNRKQLFIDYRFVTQARGIELTMNPPVKLGVALTGTKPWDNGVIDYGTVLQDQGKYRMWYTTEAVLDNSMVNDEAVSRLCYAESDDAVHWTKPSLGIYAWEGSTANNILLEITHPSACVMIDPKGTAAERYKLVARLHARSKRWPNGNAIAGSGLYMCTSPDGLHWTIHPERIFPFDPDTQNMTLYDDSTGKYLAYVRTWNPWRRVGVIETDDLMKPWPYYHGIPRHTAVGVGPSHAPSREVDDAFGADAEDSPDIDYYTSAVVKYPWAEDTYLMFPSPYHRFPEPPATKFHNDGILDVAMAVSRNGHRFHRVSRDPYIGLGLKGSRDSLTLYMIVGLLRNGHDLFQYYVGHDYTHGGYVALPEMRHRGDIFIVRQRIDGFVSADAGAAAGQFATPPVVFRGKKLTLNMDASATGEVQVELQDAQGNPLPGFTFAESDLLYGNDLAQTVTWRHGAAEVGSLAGIPVRVAFRLRLAKLYAFQFGD